MIQLKDALRNLDFNLTENKALKLAKVILKNQEYIEILDLLDVLECVDNGSIIKKIN